MGIVRHDNNIFSLSMLMSFVYATVLSSGISMWLAISTRLYLMVNPREVDRTREATISLKHDSKYCLLGLGLGQAQKLCSCCCLPHCAHAFVLARTCDHCITMTCINVANVCDI